MSLGWFWLPLSENPSHKPEMKLIKKRWFSSLKKLSDIYARTGQCGFPPTATKTFRISSLLSRPQDATKQWRNKSQRPSKQQKSLSFIWQLGWILIISLWQRTNTVRCLLRSKNHCNREYDPDAFCSMRPPALLDVVVLLCTVKCWYIFLSLSWDCWNSNQANWARVRLEPDYNL
jgi:hypothetical protein